MTLKDVPRPTRLVALAVLAAAFVAGTAAGTAFDRMLSAGQPEERATADEEPPRKLRHSDLLERLSLSEDQHRRIQTIMQRRRSQVKAFWEEAGPHLRSIADSARTDIRAVLTPEQRAAYDSLQAEMRGAKHMRWTDEDDETAERR